MVTAGLSASGQEGPEAGEQSFITNCSPCHGVHQEKLGPMLAGITHKKTRQWLVTFIRDAQAVVLSGDPYATHLYEAYNQVVMPSFDALTDGEIEDILRYIDFESEQSLRDEGPDYFPAAVDLYTDAAVVKGGQLFMQECVRCHFIGSEHKGPSLGSVTRRRTRKWLERFIRHPEQMIREDTAYLQEMADHYHLVMPSFDFLDEAQIDQILAYIDHVSTAPTAIAGVNGGFIGPHATVKRPPQSNTYTSEPVYAGKPVIRVLLIIVSLLGASVHAFLIFRFFLFLSGRDHQ